MNEWGPWIEHDGKGCPYPRGTLVQAEFDSGETHVFKALSNQESAVARGLSAHGSWDWRNEWLAYRIIRHRTRKPRGLVVLEKLLVDLPETVDA